MTVGELIDALSQVDRGDVHITVRRREGAYGYDLVGFEALLRHDKGWTFTLLID